MSPFDANIEFKCLSPPVDQLKRYTRSSMLYVNSVHLLRLRTCSQDCYFSLVKHDIYTR